MKKEDIERFEELWSKLLSIKSDVALLSSKKPSDQLNKFKIKYINDVLAKSIHSLVMISPTMILRCLTKWPYQQTVTP